MFIEIGKEQMGWIDEVRDQSSVRLESLGFASSNVSNWSGHILYEEINYMLVMFAAMIYLGGFLIRLAV